MSITNELRERIDAVCRVSGWDCKRLTAIADRIDAVLAERYVELPKDADGEYVHIGDVMAYADNTKPMEVVALVPPAVFSTEDGPRYADMCRHYHAPTVEDLLRQFLGECEHASMLGYTDMPQDIFDTYTAKLQLRGDAE